MGLQSFVFGRAYFLFVVSGRGAVESLLQVLF
jgi:hypothetical protein